MNNNFIIDQYILILGILLLLMGIFELIVPLKILELWNKWINHKLFFIHGLLLIIFGFPLILYNNSLSEVIYVIGLIIIFTGPFILIYSDKIKNIFQSLMAEMKTADKKILIYLDGCIRIFIGLLFIFSHSG